MSRGTRTSHREACCDAARDVKVASKRLFEIVAYVFVMRVTSESLPCKPHGVSARREQYLRSPPHPHYTDFLYPP